MQHVSASACWFLHAVMRLQSELPLEYKPIARPIAHSPLPMELVGLWERPDSDNTCYKGSRAKRRTENGERRLVGRQELYSRRLTGALFPF